MPVVTLTEYQKRWINDKARLKLARWTRQGGKDFSETLDEVLECNEKKTSWIILSAGERQSKRTVAQAKTHALAIDAAAEVLQESYDVDDGDGKKSRYTAHILGFPNGSEIIGLPANPDTARGWPSNVFLNEFAFHKNSRGIFTALYPSITRGYRFRVMSTPNGKNNKFHELDGNENYSKHIVDLFLAVAEGLDLGRNEDGTPITPEQLIAGMGDDEAAAQEFLVQFLDEATAFITYDLISACEDPEIEIMPEWTKTLVAMAQASYDMYRQSGKEIPLDTSSVFMGLEFAGDLFLGMDIARKRHLTVLWLDEKVGRVMTPRAVISLHNTPFYQQKLVLHALLSLPKMRRFQGDQTGLGMQLCEQAHDLFGSKVEPVNFTTANKEALAGKLKDSLEDRRRVLPQEVSIRNSIHSVRRYTTPTGHFRFDAEATERTGHGDYFWAAALAEMAGSGPGVEAAEIRREPQEGLRQPAAGGRQSMILGDRPRLGMRDVIRAGREFGV